MKAIGEYGCILFLYFLRRDRPYNNIIAFAKFEKFASHAETVWVRDRSDKDSWRPTFSPEQ